MEVLRTPDERFGNLPDYPWEPHYLEVPCVEGSAETLRMHYIDAGSTDGRLVLLLHGEPSWSFLYRKMIPIFEEAGFRIIAPDLVGFGRSDKPARTEDYTYERHLFWLGELVRELDLEDIHLICQDWGGLLGLRLLAAEPQRFSKIVAANTFLPTGEEKFPDAFFKWREMSQKMPEFSSSTVLQMGTVHELQPDVLAAYDAPFPSEEYKAGARVFPALVPTQVDAPSAAENRRAWETLETLELPFLTAFADSDPITGGLERKLQDRIPGCRGQAHQTIEDAGHFLQEDRGPALARAALAFFLA